jgi:hypothetical protein
LVRAQNQIQSQGDEQFREAVVVDRGQHGDVLRDEGDEPGSQQGQL